jgi:hypothetical protein
MRQQLAIPQRFHSIVAYDGCVDFTVVHLPQLNQHTHHMQRLSGISEGLRAALNDRDLHDLMEEHYRLLASVPKERQV